MELSKLPKVLIDYSLSSIAEFLECQLIGEDIRIDGFNLSNRDVIADSVLSYSASERFVKIARKNVKIKALVIPKSLYETLDDELKKRFSYILADNPEWSFYKAFIYLHNNGVYSKYDWKTDRNDCFIMDNAVVEKGVILGKNVTIGTNSVVKAGTIIGDNVSIGACSVVGSDGFQLIKDDEGNNQVIPHVGRTYIGNNVTIGDNVSISKSLFEGYTFIDNNVKIDSQAHVAHNCYIGSNSVICANTTLLGSCFVGNDVWVAPNSLIMNRVKVGDGAFICAASFVMGNVLRGAKMFGSPARKIE